MALRGSHPPFHRAFSLSDQIRNLMIKNRSNSLSFLLYVPVSARITDKSRRANPIANSSHQYSEHPQWCHTFTGSPLIRDLPHSCYSDPSFLELQTLGVPRQRRCFTQMKLCRCQEKPLNLALFPFFIEVPVDCPQHQIHSGVRMELNKAV